MARVYQVNGHRQFPIATSIGAEKQRRSITHTMAVVLMPRYGRNEGVLAPYAKCRFRPSDGANVTHTGRDPLQEHLFVAIACCTDVCPERWRPEMPLRHPKNLGSWVRGERVDRALAVKPPPDRGIIVWVDPEL
jgi:hypothetical protein